MRATAEWIAALQLPTGMIPWFPGGHCDPWNHVETAMALDVAGLHDAAAHAYRWLADIQRPDGSWWNYYLPDGIGRGRQARHQRVRLRRHRACGTTGCAPPTGRSSTSCGRWCSARSTGCCRCAAPTGRSSGPATPTTPRGTTRCSPARRASPTRCAAACTLGAVVGERHRAWSAAADVLAERVTNAPDAFEPKDRWAMDWYYPVLTGTLTGEPAKARLAEGWDDVRHGGQGHPLRQRRAVGHRVGDRRVLARPLGHRRPLDGHRPAALDPFAPPRRRRVLDRHRVPDEERFPAGELSAYTGAAVVLAADAIAGASPASGVFVPR